MLNIVMLSFIGYYYYIMNHDRDQPENFQNSLIERTPKAVLQALNLSIKYSRPFPSDLKIDQEVLKGRETVKGDF